MSILNFCDFDRLYKDVLSSIWPFWTTAMQVDIARHNVGWATGRTDFRLYLEASSFRYFCAYRQLQRHPLNCRVCDVGGFWGAFPLTLARLGYDVVMTEELRYYSGSFSRLFGFLRSSGVQIVDYDPFSDESAPPVQCDFVAVMAVLEHYPHSLRTFMRNATALLAPAGQLYLEVPNIAYWPKRVALLRGQTPLVPIRDIYESQVPFIGHHHEFTRGELRDLARLAELEVVAEHAFNYSGYTALTIPAWMRHPIQSSAFRWLRNSRELLVAVCERRKTTHVRDSASQRPAD